MVGPGLMRGGDDGSGLKERSNGGACWSEGRWSCGSISRVEDGGEEGAKGGGKAIAYQIVGFDFADSSSLKDMITEWVIVLATWAEGFISFVK